MAEEKIPEAKKVSPEKAAEEYEQRMTWQDGDLVFTTKGEGPTLAEMDEAAGADEEVDEKPATAVLDLYLEDDGSIRGEEG